MTLEEVQKFLIFYLIFIENRWNSWRSSNKIKTERFFNELFNLFFIIEY